MMEELLDIPHGHLRPAYVYHPEQDTSILQHLDNPLSRFMEIWTGSNEDGSIFASRWIVTTLDSRSPRRGVLFLHIERPGTVMPILHSGFQEGHLPGSNLDLWQYLSRHETESRIDLVRRFGGQLRLRGM